MTHLQYQFPLASEFLVERMGNSRGLKYELPDPAPIPAIADGYIIHSQENTSKGNIAIVAHDDGYYTLYGGIEPIRKSQLNKPIYRNYKLSVADEHLYLMVLDSKLGWINGAAYDPVAFIRGRLSPSTRNGLHGYSVEQPDAEVWEKIKRKLKAKSLLHHLTDDRAARRGIQMFVSNHTAPIVFDGVIGRYSVVGIQRFINTRGYDIEVNGHLDKKTWEIFSKCL